MARTIFDLREFLVQNCKVQVVKPFMAGETAIILQRPWLEIHRKSPKSSKLSSSLQVALRRQAVALNDKYPRTHRALFSAILVYWQRRREHCRTIKLEALLCCTNTTWLLWNCFRGFTYLMYIFVYFELICL